MSELLFGAPLDHFLSFRAWGYHLHQAHVSPGGAGTLPEPLCMMEAKVSPANAWEMAPPERKECMEKSCGIPAAAYDLRSFVI